MNGRLLSEPTDKMMGAGASVLTFYCDEDDNSLRRLARLLWRAMGVIGDKERGITVADTETFYGEEEAHGKTKNG